MEKYSNEEGFLSKIKKILVKNLQTEWSEQTKSRQFSGKLIHLQNEIPCHHRLIQHLYCKMSLKLYLKDANKHCLIQNYSILIHAAFSNSTYSN